MSEGGWVPKGPQMSEILASLTRPTIYQNVKDLLRRGEVPARRRRRLFVRRTWSLLTVPLAAAFLFTNNRIHPGHEVGWMDLLWLSYRLYRNTTRVFVGTGPTAHLAMAAKLLELDPAEEGVVVECGCFVGGSTANLSLVCDLVGRDLVVYDSFAGLPADSDGDEFATEDGAGVFAGSLDTVRSNVEQLGVADRCEFRQGWFEDTLPSHAEPVALCYMDVDYQASIHTVLENLWPHLVDGGCLFTDDFKPVGLGAIFFKEEFWRGTLDCEPPGLLGAGTGIPLGEVFLGPWRGFGGDGDYPLQTPGATAYTYKGSTASWDYVPGED